MSLPIFEGGYEADDAGTDGAEAFYQGYRKLSDAELTSLSEAMVQEVKSRGPFLSMSDFVNRRLNDTDLEHQQRGALQAALDQTVNQNIAGSMPDQP